METYLQHERSLVLHSTALYCSTQKICVLKKQVNEAKLERKGKEIEEEGFKEKLLIETSVLQGKFDKMEWEYEMERNDHAAKLEHLKSLEEQLQCSKTYATEMKQQKLQLYNDTCEEVAAYRREVLRLETKKCKLEKQLSMLWRKVAELKEQLSAAHAQSVSFQHTLKATQAETAAGQERLSLYQAESECLQERLAASESEKEHLQLASQREKQNLEDEVQSLREIITERNQQKRELQRLLSVSQVEETTVQEQNHMLRDRLSEAEEQNRTLQERLAAYQTETADLRERLAQQQMKPERYPERVDITPWNVPRSDVHTSPEEIGRGGWGVVLRGTYEGETVAVKQPHRDLLNQRLLERLKRETRLMIQISHPNLVRIIAVVFDEAAERLRRPPLIVTELLDMNLRQCYQERRLQPRNRVPVFLDVARGLHYMHDRTEPIIHRDVSAPNVLLKALPNGRWRAKVSDFGSANLARLSVTAGEGAIIYTAPEAFPPRSPDSPRPRHTTKIDVYSFGILVCEVVTAEQPDPELYQVRLGQVGRLSRPLHSLVVRCTDHNPDKRPTMATVIQELSNISLP